MMQFDIGYGRFGGGIHYRPMLDIKYTVPKENLHLEASCFNTISKDGIKDSLKSGFDKDGEKVYGYIEFDLSKLPEHNSNIITDCALKIKNKNVPKKKSDVRFYVELVELDEVGGFEDIKNREKIEYIGYEVAENDLKNKEYQYFKFDTLSRQILDKMHQEGKKLKLVIKPTSSLGAKNRVIEWSDDVALDIKYIQKRREPLNSPKSIKITKENKMIKLTWDRVEDSALKGYYVVRNSFHPPKNFLDGVKLYGGKDNWTYDNFGSFDKEKYYAVFSYDETPNFSEPVVIKYDPLEKY
jgi:hypothetical protein